MSPFDLPALRADEFLGLDTFSDEERLPLGALVRADNVRVDDNGNLVPRWGATSRVSFTDAVLDMVHYYGNDEIAAVGVTGTTATVYDVARNFGSATSRGTFTVSPSDVDMARLVSIYERVFVSVYKNSLRVLNNTTLSVLASSDTDLDQDADSTDELPFTTISEYNGHLVGFGFGDEQGTGGEETADLGPDRPEIMRWSHLGQPLKWRPGDWLMIGVRGQPCMQGVTAFGRHVVFKPEGVFLVYGDLEQNFPVVETLETEAGIAPGGVGPNGAAYFDHALYYLSHAGPMRWTGGTRVENIGRAIENDLTPGYRNYAAQVVPWPEEGLILFVCDYDPDNPTAAFPGGTKWTTVPASVDAWMWDVARERWVGKVADWGASLRPRVLPNTLSFRAPFYHSGTALHEIEPAGTISECEVRTGVVELNERRHACVRGVLLEGDWVDHTGALVIDAYVDGASAKLRKLYVDASSATASETGDLWYDTTNGYCLEWNGSAWVRQPGMPEGVVRMPMNQVGRTVQVRMRLAGGSSGMQHTIRRLAVQVTP